jgi:hypothetical protein
MCKYNITLEHTLFMVSTFKVNIYFLHLKVVIISATGLAAVSVPLLKAIKLLWLQYSSNRDPYT